MSVSTWLRMRSRHGEDGHGGERRDAALEQARLAATSDWVWPAFVTGAATNVTGRNWTAIGNIASPHRAIVDPRGLITPLLGGWSLDWSIGAEDRWHFPSRDHAVRQALVGTTPVVETMMRIPSGDAVARAYTIVGDGALGDLAVLEIENQSPVPVALALTVRPCNPDGLVDVDQIELAGNLLMVNGRAAVLLPRPPSASVGRAFVDGDVAGWVAAGATGNELGSVRCDDRLASAALVYPLAHRATLRFAMPLAPGAVAASATLPVLPCAADVARAWEAQARRGLRVTIPPGRLADAFEANRKYVLSTFGGRDLIASPSRPESSELFDATVVIGALDRLGFHTEAREVLVDLPERQRFDGSLSDSAAAHGAAIVALADHWRMTRDRDLVVQTAPAVALAARWIDRSRASGRRGGGAAGLVGTPGASEAAGPSPYRYWDNLWCLRGLIDAAELLEASDNHGGASACVAAAAKLRAAIDRSLSEMAVTSGSLAMPAGPDRQMDAGAVWSLAARAPLGLVGPADPRVVATIAAIDESFCQGLGVLAPVGSGGIGTRATMQLAAAELACGQPAAVGRISWVVEASSATFTWPAVMEALTGVGRAGEGHSGVAAAAFATLVRDLLVTEDDGGLALCRVLPPDWEGQGFEVHDAPTAFGSLSFAVRWHGTRPALLWDLAVHTGAEPVALRAPGLDPSWATTEPRGEALFAAFGTTTQEFS